MEIDLVSMLVIASVCMIIVIGMSNGAVQQSNITDLNAYTFNFTENPHDGDLMQLDGITYQFLNTIPPNNPNNYIYVQIAATTADTVNNLRYAIDDNTHYNVS